MIYPAPAEGGDGVFTTKLVPAVFVVTCINVGEPDTYSHDRRITEFAVISELEMVVLLDPVLNTRP